ncbi:response regulator [Leptospira levettii]|uniref:Response regulator n=1 Tax=Leptospira levettii TaxID=2023178 RepID=A0AAW5VAQ3_9LEPT|nr:response regulator [Leptospira levettii]MCW7464578.1 response regulator [Leptospira levettii]MCW7495355.1 response regulator [Leptospira levettii]MCW7511238.1 response regulator [Leptospira levettii]MCW7514992.1 response regulator [Leptospira levettii]TGM32430.1 response regulator [Leptospira levettii]
MSNILVVDDSPAVLKIVRLALSSQGHEIIICESGESALDILKSNTKIKLGIFDFNMPGINGLELIQKSKKTMSGTKLKILILSVESKPEIISKALFEGADAWIVKPFKNEDLINKVNELLEEHDSV